MNNSANHIQPARAALTALLLALAITALAGSPALAARGHVFGGTFGAPGSGKGQFEKPAGVAVNEATGDVYVVDEGNGRVERFSATGVYLGQFDGSGSFEVVENGVAKQETGGKPATGKFDEPRTVAVDNACVQQRPKLIGSACESFDESAGDVYVVDGAAVGHRVVDKFTSVGEYVGTVALESVVFGGFPTGVAVDAQGELWVAIKGLINPGGVELNSVEGVERFSNALVNKHVESFAFGFGGHNLRHGLAVDSEDNLYAGINFESPFEQVVAKVNAKGEPVSEAVELETSSGVASELPGNDVYVNNLASVARLDRAGGLVERFGEGHLPSVSEVEAFEPFGRDAYDAGVAVDGASEEGEVYVPDQVAGDVVVFPLEGPGPPTIEGTSVADVTGSSATFQAQVNPRGALSEYHFEYGACPSVGTCVGAPFDEIAPEPEGMVGAPFDFEGAQVSVHPQDLAPATTYHFRVVAHNEKSSSGTVVAGEEETFTTQPVLPFELPDGRSWELVSPAQKHGTLIESISESNVIQAAADGAALTYVTASPTEDDPHGFSNFVQVLSSRAGSGWVSQDLGLSHPVATGPAIGTGKEYRLFSEDLSVGLVQPFGAFEPLTSSQASEQTPYLRTDFSGVSTGAQCVSGCYLPLVTAGNVREGAHFGEEGKCPPKIVCGPQVVGASPDAEHVVLESQVGLTSVTGDEGGLYEWSAGGLTLVSVLPDGKPAPPAEHPQLGAGPDRRRSVSADGTRVVWSEGSGQNPHLYLRDVPNEETVELDKGLTGIPLFQAASADGSRIFFTDGGGDLYVYEVEKGEAVRLTTPLEAGERTGVQGLIAGVSEDGSYAYFVANARLTEEGGSVKGSCSLAAAGSATDCNLYELREQGGVWGAPKLVAVLSGEDGPDFAPDLRDLTARVSPDGRFLAFMSDRSLTGYDNSDAVSGKKLSENCFGVL